MTTPALRCPLQGPPLRLAQSEVFGDLSLEFQFSTGHSWSLADGGEGLAISQPVR